MKMKHKSKKQQHSTEPTNTDRLTHGAKVYAKKRKGRLDKNEVEAVVYDEEARKDYLTGFHKRKLERRRMLEEKRKKREKEDRKELKKEKRERAKERLMILETAGKFIKEDDGDNDEADGVDAADKVQQMQFKTLDALVTVTTVSDFKFGDDDDVEYDNHGGNDDEDDE